MIKHTRTDAYLEEIIFMLSFIVMMLAFHFNWKFVGWCFLLKSITDLISAWYVAWKEVVHEKNTQP